MPTRLLLCLPLLLSACAPAPPPEPTVPATHGAAIAIVRRHLARYDGLKSLELAVERTTTAGGIARSERWTFRQKGQDRFRVDYTHPHKRTIIGTPSDLWEYIPQAKKAAHTDLKSLTPDLHAEALQAVLNRVALNGLRFAAELPDEAAEGPQARLALLGERNVSGRSCHCIEVAYGKDAARGLRGWIDAERLVLMRCEFLAKGKVVARVTAKDILSVAPNVWFPRTLHFQAMDRTGARQEITFTRVRVNASMDDSLFTFEPPEGVEVIRP
ncbi:hypothetical protein HQ560_19940 [bacterium]|nr:hypothetical protein [bacterium]